MAADLTETSDTAARLARPRWLATSLTAAAPLWHAFMYDLTKSWPITKFHRPKKVVAERIDAWSGGEPGPWTRETTREWFIAGTEPGRRKAVDRDGLLYRQACGGWRVDPVKAELGPSAWRRDVRDWLARAHAGIGVRGRHGSRTAYFWGERSWGGPLAGACFRPAPERRDKDKGKDERDKDDKGPGRGPGNGNGPGNGDGGGSRVQIEDRLPRAVLGVLEARGHAFETVGRKGEVKYGYAAVAVVNANRGTVEGGAEPRRSHATAAPAGTEVKRDER